METEGEHVGFHPILHVVSKEGVFAERQRGELGKIYVDNETWSYLPK